HVGLFAQGGLGRIGHAFGPDVKTAAETVGGDLPKAPDASALVVTLVSDIVLADIALVPAALAVGDGVLPLGDKGTTPVAPFAGDLAGAKGQAQLHLMPSGDGFLQEKTGPRAAGEA